MSPAVAFRHAFPSLAIAVAWLSDADAFQPLAGSGLTFTKPHKINVVLPYRLLSLQMGMDDEDSELFPKAATMELKEEEDESESLNKADAVILKEAKEELLALGKLTKRGFDSTPKQRKRARELADTIAQYNPTAEPAWPFYHKTMEELAKSTTPEGPTLKGKWTLVYTDAPDIVTLDAGPLAASKLGRIGQECEPPFINNIIEWKKPDWAKQLPMSGSDDSRVLQKVCCEAVSSPEDPRFVDLKLVGLDLFGFAGTEDGEGKAGGPAAYLEENPVELRGAGGFKAPFGRFEILYLDQDLRIIKTAQNFLAVNTRDKVEWF